MHTQYSMLNDRGAAVQITEGPLYILRDEKSLLLFVGDLWMWLNKIGIV